MTLLTSHPNPVEQAHWRDAAVCFSSACTTLLLLPALAHASIEITGAHNNNANGSGYTIANSTDTFVVNQGATFNGNNFNGLLDWTQANVIVNGGSFQHNNNVGFQVLAGTGNFIRINGGSFSNNVSAGAGGGGLDVYSAALTVNGGDFSGNSAYGLGTHSPTIIHGGTISGNGSVGLIVFDSQTTLSGGTFSGNSRDLGVSSNSVLYVQGSFDKSGVLTGTGTFTGTLAEGGAAHTFSYFTQSGGRLVLSAVPEPASAWLLVTGLTGFAGLAWRRRSAVTAA